MTPRRIRTGAERIWAVLDDAERVPGSTGRVPDDAERVRAVPPAPPAPPGPGSCRPEMLRYHRYLLVTRGATR